MTQEEWQRFIDAPYRPTCDAPVPSDVVEALTVQSLDRIQAGEAVTAVTRLARVVALPSGTAANPEAVARWHLAQALIAEGHGRARAGQIEDAIAKYQEALALDPELDVDPETEAGKLAATSLVAQGMAWARNGQIDDAIAAYEKAKAVYPEGKISALAWNNLCWFGSLYRQAAEVGDACEQAVALDPLNGGIRDSRGLNRALLRDFDGAIEDFQAFVEWTNSEDKRLQRQGWIEALQAGEDPFTPEVLEGLRGQ